MGNVDINSAWSIVFMVSLFIHFLACRILGRGAKRIAPELVAVGPVFQGFFFAAGAIAAFAQALRHDMVPFAAARIFEPNAMGWVVVFSTMCAAFLIFHMIMRLFDGDALSKSESDIRAQDELDVVDG